MAESKVTAFRRTVWAHYKKHGRHDLPWRNLRPLPASRQAYKILVSEVMLQQTQVKRVIAFYAEFTRCFPTIQKLAKAPLADVLKIWQGLGYNRRAKMFHQAAKVIIEKYGGKFPRRIAELEKLPGVGSYTARAVAVFAFNQDVILVETNIRTAILLHFFARGSTMIYHSDPQKVSDADIVKILERVLPKGRAREWHSALMDYGAYLKQSGVKLNAKSKHYAKQSKFAGSLREARGAILRALASGKKYQGLALMNLLGPSRRPQLRTALTALLSEGLIQRRGRVYALPR